MLITNILFIYFPAVVGYCFMIAFAIYVIKRKKQGKEGKKFNRDNIE